MALGQERWGPPFCRSGFLLICKLFSAGFFGVTKRPPKADYTKESQSTQRRRKLAQLSIQRYILELAKEKVTKNCLRQFGVYDNSSFASSEAKSSLPFYRSGFLTNL